MKLQHSFHLDLSRETLYKHFDFSGSSDMNDPAKNDYIVERFGHVLKDLPHVVWEW